MSRKTRRAARQHSSQSGQDRLGSESAAKGGNTKSLSWLVALLSLFVTLLTAGTTVATYRLQARVTELETTRQQQTHDREARLGRVRFVGHFVRGDSLRLSSTNGQHVLASVSLTLPGSVTHEVMVHKYGPDARSRSFWSNELVDKIEGNSFWFPYSDLHRILAAVVPTDRSIDGVPSRVAFTIGVGFYDNNELKHDCGIYSINFDNYRTSDGPVTLNKPRVTYDGECRGSEVDQGFVDSVWIAERAQKGANRTFGGIQEYVEPSP